MSVIHAEFTIERHYDCTPAADLQRVLGPRAEAPVVRQPRQLRDAEWELDFRVGGGEVNGGGPPGGPATPSGAATTTSSRTSGSSSPTTCCSTTG